MRSLSMVAYLSVRPGQYARLTVRDTGVGIAADAQARVFEPFFTTKDHTKSTGLGLSIVYSIVRIWAARSRFRRAGAGNHLRGAAADGAYA